MPISYYYNPEKDNARPFPSDSNVRVLISGLVLCNLTKEASSFSFLRDVPDHSLRMVIKCIDRTGREIITPRFIRSNETVEISTGSVTQIPRDVDYDGTLKWFLRLRRLHNASIARNNNPKPTSELTLDNTSFYSHELTNSVWALATQTDPASEVEGRFCFTLGGYMSSVSDEVILTVRSSNGTEDVFHLDTRQHDIEITFNNHCLGPHCISDNDFRHYYGVVHEVGKEHRQFDAERKPSLKATLMTPAASPSIGACLPVCENCEP